MLLRIVLLAAITVAASPALADTVRCADANGEVSVEYDIGEANEPNMVTRVQMQITDDFGISTDPAHEDHDGEEIAFQFVTNDILEVTLAVPDGLPVLDLKLVEAGADNSWMRAGVVAVSGGGTWVITCN